MTEKSRSGIRFFPESGQFQTGSVTEPWSTLMIIFFKCTIRVLSAYFCVLYSDLMNYFWSGVFCQILRRSETLEIGTIMARRCVTLSNIR